MQIRANLKNVYHPPNVSFYKSFPLESFRENKQSRCFFPRLPWRRRLFNIFFVFSIPPSALNQRVSEDPGMRSLKPAIINQTSLRKFPESLRQQSALRHVFIAFKMSAAIYGVRTYRQARNISVMRHIEYIYTLVCTSRWVERARCWQTRWSIRYQLWRFEINWIIV